MLSQHDLPKGILKSSIGYTKNLCTKNAELQTAKLTKPVLKRESEESEQPAILSNSEVSLRSILKSNLNLKSIQIANAATITNEENSNDIESQNQSSETAKFCERLDSSDITTNVTQHNLQYFCDDMQTIVFKKSVENRVTVPSHKTAIFQNEKILLNDINNYNIDAISNNRAIEILIKRDDKCERTHHNNLSIDKSNRISDVHYDNDNDNDNNENEDNEKDADNEKQKRIIAEQNVDNDDQGSSSSNDYEVHNIITNDKHTNITQCFNLLTKNIHQHLRDDERRKPQQCLEQPCRSATQVITSIETSETPNVSIADRLAALHHSGNTSWKQRVADGKINESFDKLLSAEENTMIKSGVLAGCIEKLESSMESWKNRIVIPDAINFTVAGKMKVVPSKDGNSSFFTDSIPNISNKKKKAPCSQRFKTRKGKKRKFSRI